MKRLILGSVTPVVASLIMVGSAWAQSGVKMCIPEAPRKAILSPNECTNTKIKYKVVELGKEGKEGPEGKVPFNTEDLALIKNVLAHIKYLTNAIDGEPTTQFSGVNVQIVNGSGNTATTNGVGNLAIGYDETPNGEFQEGSHNLMLGVEQNTMGYGGIVAGAKNRQLGAYSSVTGGRENIVIRAEFMSVSGGKENLVEGNLVEGTGASVSGGEKSSATGKFASVSGGGSRDVPNMASGINSSISGGGGIGQNRAVATNSSVSGGSRNTAVGVNAWDGGGSSNAAEGADSAIFGGLGLDAKGEFEAIP